MKFKIQEEVLPISGDKNFCVYAYVNDDWVFKQMCISIESAKRYCENVNKPRVINTTYLEI